MQAFDVTYYDGRSATPHPARASRIEDRLVLTSPSGEAIGEWRLADLRIASQARDGLPGRITLGGDGAGRLSFTDRLLAAELMLADRRIAGDRIGEFKRGLRRVAIPLVVAAIGVVMLFTLVLPMLAPVIARQISPSAERRLGAASADAVIALFGRDPSGNPQRLCAAPAGTAALATMVARLAAAAPLPFAPRVRVVNTDMVNAFALPGGEVLVFRGLIDYANSPEELAGVLAHEFSHIALRHPLEMAIRRTTTSATMGLIFGDVIGLSLFGGLASQLVASSYSREIEETADTAGLARLHAAAIDGSGVASFMARLGADETRQGGTLPSYLSTHPPSTARAAAARGSDWASTPVLNDAQWQDLRRICAPPARPNTRG